MEMTSLWTAESAVHRDLEISLRARDFHIPTARILERWTKTSEKRGHLKSVISGLGRSALTLEAAVRQKPIHGAAAVISPTAVRDLLTRVTDAMRSEIQGQYIAKRAVFLAGSRIDPATTTAETIRWFDDRWNVLEERLKIVPGTQVLHRLRDHIQSQWQVNLTDIRIVDAFRSEEVAPDLAELVRKLDAFRAT